MSKTNRYAPRSFLAILAIVPIAAAINGCAIVADDSLDDSQQAAKNGALSGAHETLNIIGVNSKSTNIIKSASGSNIFVSLSGECRIDLFEGPFKVLDKDCTDGVAAFQLPGGGHSVYIRALGSPGGVSWAKTCAKDAAGQTYCASSLITARGYGAVPFVDASAQLLFTAADLDGDGTAETYPLFDEALEGYSWSYLNQDTKIAQLRFYKTADRMQVVTEYAPMEYVPR
jgi:hypothetical protein